MRIPLSDTAHTELLSGRAVFAVAPVIPKPVPIKSSGALYAHGDHAWRSLNNSAVTTVSNRPYGPRTWAEDHGPKPGPVHARWTGVDVPATLLSVELGRLHSTPHAELYDATRSMQWKMIAGADGRLRWVKHASWPRSSTDPWVWVFHLAPPR